MFGILYNLMFLKDYLAYLFFEPLPQIWAVFTSAMNILPERFVLR